MKNFNTRSKNLAFLLRKNVKMLLVISSLFAVITISTLPNTTDYGLRTVYAADSSASAKLSADLKSKLDELKKEIASKAASLKQEINRKLMDKAYVGTVKAKTDSSLTLASKTGARIVTINQDTDYRSNLKSKQKFSLKTLNEEDYVAALGDIDDNGVLTAKRVILLSPPKDGKTFLWGQVISISDKLITIKNRELKNIAVSVGSADFKKGEQEISLSDLEVRDFIILTGSMGKNDIFQAGFIYVVPQGGFIRHKKLATPSAQLSSASASPKAQSSSKK